MPAAAPAAGDRIDAAQERAFGTDPRATATSRTGIGAAVVPEPPVGPLPQRELGPAPRQDIRVQRSAIPAPIAPRPVVADRTPPARALAQAALISARAPHPGEPWSPGTDLGAARNTPDTAPAPGPASPVAGTALSFARRIAVQRHTATSPVTAVATLDRPAPVPAPLTYRTVEVAAGESAASALPPATETASIQRDTDGGAATTQRALMAGGADTSAAGPAVTPAGYQQPDQEQIEELANRLVGPLARRLKAEMLLDRERRGVRIDTW
jgi:hypothetical protein